MGSEDGDYDNTLRIIIIISWNTDDDDGGGVKMMEEKADYLQSGLKCT